MIDRNRSLLRFDSVRKCETLYCLDFVYYSNSDQCLSMIDFWEGERDVSVRLAGRQSRNTPNCRLVARGEIECECATVGTLDVIEILILSLSAEL